MNIPIIEPLEKTDTKTEELEFRSSKFEFVDLFLPVCVKNRKMELNEEFEFEKIDNTDQKVRQFQTFGVFEGKSCIFTIKVKFFVCP